MEQLERREYTRDEIGEITGREPRSGHFSRDVQNDLQVWGYGYRWIPRRGVLITKVPETASERLSELMIRAMGLNVQVDVKAFSCFLYLLLTMDDFARMPWQERAKEITRQFGFSIDESTLRRWTSYLLKNNVLEQSRADYVYWRTRRENGINIREKVIDPETDEAYQAYKKRQHQLYEKLKDPDDPGKKIGQSVFSTLWNEFQSCYYRCSCLMVNAIGNENIDDMIALTWEVCQEILTENAEWEKIKVNTA